MGNEEIRRSNPIVKGDKIQKLWHFQNIQFFFKY